jgi:hypothetical protein
MSAVTNPNSGQDLNHALYSDGFYCFEELPLLFLSSLFPFLFNTHAQILVLERYFIRMHISCLRIQRCYSDKIIWNN